MTKKLILNIIYTCIILFVILLTFCLDDVYLRIILLIFIAVNFMFYLRKAKTTNWFEKQCLMIFTLLIMFMFNIPFSSNIRDKFILNNNELNIISLNEKNTDSYDDEVWIDSILLDGEVLDLNHFSNQNPDWKVNGRLNYHGEAESTYRMSVKPQKSLQVRFVKHPYSGLCQVNMNDYEKQIDLYSINDEYLELDLSSYLIQNTSIRFYFLLTLIYCFIYFALKEILFRLLNWICVRKKYDIDYTWFTYASICFASWIIYYLAFYPALFSGDTLGQWNQIMTGNYNDGHPAFHTFILKILISVTKTPAIIPLLQIIITSIVIGKFMILFYQNKVSNKILFTVTIFIAVFPANGIMLMNIWKDIPYSITILALTYALLVIYLSKGGWIKKNLNKIYLALLLTLLFIFRHNGIIPYIATIITLCFVYHRQLKEVIKVFILSLTLIIIIKVPLYSLMNVDKVPEGVALSFFMHHVGTIYNENGNISEKEKSMMDQIMPLELWKTNYEKYAHNKYCFSGFPYFVSLTENKTVATKLYLSVAIKNIDIVLKDVLNLTNMIWKIPKPKDGFIYIADYNFDYTDPNLGEESKYISKHVNYVKTDLTSKMIEFIDKTINNYSNFFWRIAGFHLILLFCILFILVLKKYQLLIVIVPVTFNVASLFISMISQDYRYLYSSTLVIPVVLCCLFMKTENRFNQIERKYYVEDTEL